MATQTMTSTDVPSASAVALAAASSSRPLKHRPSPLPTPQSATFPSSLQSPLPSATRPGSASFLRPEKSLKTPLTPPSAYLSFLRAVDKAKTPLSSNNTSAPFTFSSSDLRSPYPWPKQPASARPILTTVESVDSNVSAASTTSLDSRSTTTTSAISTTGSGLTKPLARRASDGASSKSQDHQRPASTSQLPSRPHPAIRRPSLMIPESPSSRSPSLITPDSAGGPLSGSYARSPASATAARNYYLGLSPLAENGDRARSPGDTSTIRPVRIKHVITRTVTQTRVAGTTAPIGALAKPIAPTIKGNHTNAGASTSTSTSRPSTASDDEAKSKMSLDYVLTTRSDVASLSIRSSPEHNELKHKNLDRQGEADTEMGESQGVPQSVRPPSEEPWGLPPQKPLIGDAPKGKRRKM